MRAEASADRVPVMTVFTYVALGKSLYLSKPPPQILIKIAPLIVALKIKVVMESITHFND